MYGQSTYFHQGYDLMSDLDSYMRKVSKEVRTRWNHIKLRQFLSQEVIVVYFK